MAFQSVEVDVCSVDWTLTAAMFGGIGTFLVGSAALATLFIQYWHKKRSAELEEALKLMLFGYRKYIADEEGIVWDDYPKDSAQIIAGIVRKTGMNAEIVKELLDKLMQERKI